MSIVDSFSAGWVISHPSFMKETYKLVEDKSFQLNDDIFKIVSPFVKRNIATKSLKRKSTHPDFKDFKLLVDHVQELHKILQTEIPDFIHVNDDNKNKNTEAAETAQNIYEESGKTVIANAFGENQQKPVIMTINNEQYLFPQNCKFYCKDVKDIKATLLDQYDVILLDPPWWNKYIRRKKAKTDQGYSMMYNTDLKEIPIEQLLKDNALVVVWCTNSQQHFEELTKDIFTKWGIQYVARWFWLKVTQHGEPVCDFAEPPAKQPFEQIIFGAKNKESLNLPQDNKLIVSVPSALHSHKPPLVELLKPYLPEQPKCLEIFARYLLPNWTSWGLEAIRFQHESLYVPVA